MTATHRTGVAVQRVGTTVALAAVLLLIMAGPVLADPAGPTNYRSVVTSIDPRPSGVTIEVLGGDAFLSIAVAPGHSVEVPGYFGEPYLRIDTDGSVWLNTLSPARYINRDRYGVSGIPDFADSKAEPVWEKVGDNGAFAWHDHRIHWMSYDLPPTIVGDRAQSVFPWTLTVTIDGIDTKVGGELLWFPSTNAFGPLLVGMVALLPLARFRRRRVTVPVVMAAVFGAIALFVAIAQFGATPGFDRTLPVEPIFPALAIAFGMGALWLRARPLRAWAATLLAGVSLLWWAVTIGATLTAPVLASALPVSIERLAVGLSLWAGAAIIAVSVMELISAVRAGIAPLEQPSTT